MSLINRFRRSRRINNNIPVDALDASLLPGQAGVDPSTTQQDFSSHRRRPNPVIINDPINQNHQITNNGSVPTDGVNLVPTIIDDSNNSGVTGGIPSTNNETNNGATTDATGAISTSPAIQTPIATIINDPDMGAPVITDPRGDTNPTPDTSSSITTNDSSNTGTSTSSTVTTDGTPDVTNTNSYTNIGAPGSDGDSGTTSASSFSSSNDATTYDRVPIISTDNPTSYTGSSADTEDEQVVANGADADSSGTSNDSGSGTKNTSYLGFPSEEEYLEYNQQAINAHNQVVADGVDANSDHPENWEGTQEGSTPASNDTSGDGSVETNYATINLSRPTGSQSIARGVDANSDHPENWEGTQNISNNTTTVTDNPTSYTGSSAGTEDEQVIANGADADSTGTSNDSDSGTNDTSYQGFPSKEEFIQHSETAINAYNQARANEGADANSDHPENWGGTSDTSTVTHDSVSDTPLYDTFSSSNDMTKQDQLPQETLLDDPQNEDESDSFPTQDGTPSQDPDHIADAVDANSDHPDSWGGTQNTSTTITDNPTSYTGSSAGTEDEQVIANGADADSKVSDGVATNQDSNTSYMGFPSQSDYEQDFNSKIDAKTDHPENWGGTQNSSSSTATITDNPTSYAGSSTSNDYDSGGQDFPQNSTYAPTQDVIEANSDHPEAWGNTADVPPNPMDSVVSSAEDSSSNTQDATEANSDHPENWN